MTEQTKHPNYEWIVAFAEGKQLQWENVINGDWHDFDMETEDGPWADMAVNWRVKPESRWYRVALFKDANGKFWTQSADSQTLDEEAFTMNEEFVKWLTDRVEYEL